MQEQKIEKERKNMTKLICPTCKKEVVTDSQEGTCRCQKCNSLFCISAFMDMKKLNYKQIQKYIDRW
jgi:ribosomal protein L37AE/L43A